MSSTPKRFRPTPSAVIATIALVFAMTGGAYAAKKYLITSTKQISPSVLKSLKGASGKAGPAGPAGPVGTGGAGSAGPAGPTGPTGPTGPAGATGEKGIQGEKGLKGAEGKEGSPWTAGGVLPSGKTETGAWVLNPTSAFIGRSPISFTIPLGAAIENSVECGEAGHPACLVHVFVEGEAIPAGCTGTIVNERVTNLGAEPGNFCAWAEFALAVTAEEIRFTDLETGANIPSAVGRSGTAMVAPGEGAAAGTWAVTAP